MIYHMCTNTKSILESLLNWCWPMKKLPLSRSAIILTVKVKEELILHFLLYIKTKHLVN
ncbi:unnamed protein product [Arabidopsis halleri]